MKRGSTDTKTSKRTNSYILTRIWKIALVALLILSVAGFTLIRILIPDSPMYQNGAYLQYSYQIGDRAVITSESMRDTEEDSDSEVVWEEENTPKQFIEEADLIAIVEIMDIRPVGHSCGWIYTARMIKNCTIMQKNMDYLPNQVYLFQEPATSQDRTYIASEKTIFCQWPELMLWKDNIYIIFGESIDFSIPGTGYTKENTFQLKSYEINQPFKSIPAADSYDYTDDDVLYSKANTEIIDIRPLIIETELVPLEGSDAIMTYNITHAYEYEEISRYNFFAIDDEVLAVYQKWCNDILDVLRKKLLMKAYT